MVFGSLLTLTALGARLSEQYSGLTPELLAEPAPQRTPVRFRELEARNLDTGLRATAAAATPGCRLLGPARLEAASPTSVFVVADGDNGAVFELSSDGQLLDLRNTGMPRLASVSDLAFYDGQLWVADLLGSRVLRLDRRTSRWHLLQQQHEPYRLEPLRKGDGEFAVLRISGPALFGRISVQGREISTFGRLLKNQNETSLALDGFVVLIGESIVFVGQHLGLIAAFHESGDLRYLVSSIAAPPLPKVMRKGGRRWLRHGPIWASLAASAGPETISVLARRPHELEVRSWIDLYRASDGEYYRSLLLPAGERWASLAITDSEIFVASERRIVVWPRHVLAPGAFQSVGAEGRTVARLAGMEPAEGGTS